MNTVERVVKICKARKIAISKLESECGFGNGYIKKLQKGTFPQDRLLKISEFLGLPMDYLLSLKDEYGLIPDQWDQIGRMFAQFSFDNNKSTSITSHDTGIPKEKIEAFFNAGIPMSGLELHQICMAWNMPMDKVIGAYAKAFESKKAPSEDRAISDDDIKFALANKLGRDITDAQLQRILEFADFATQERNKK